jgi:DNA polymerase III epsilon subunit-like protein
MIVFFDLETGGVTNAHPNIQLAAIAVDSAFNELGSFESKIAFNEADADPEALKINHYDPALWANAPSEPVVMAKFAKFMEPFKTIQMVSKRTGNPYSVCRLAGHNAATFDGPRLKAAFARLSAFLPAHPIVLDTLQLALWRYQKLNKQVDSFKLGSLCELLEIPVDNAHDALADVRMTIAVTKKLLHGRTS